MGEIKQKKKLKVKSSHTGNKKFNPAWLIITIVTTFLLSVFISFLTSSRLNDVELGVAFFLLFLIIFIGIIFDIIGTAITAASDVPFHSMSANRVFGASSTVRLIRHSEKVANICNDIVGDICGIVSGGMGTFIVAELVSVHNFNALLSSLLATGLISALTVGGKAAGKTFAINNCNNIVYLVGRIFGFFGRKSR